MPLPHPLFLKPLSPLSVLTFLFTSETPLSIVSTMFQLRASSPWPCGGGATVMTTTSWEVTVNIPNHVSQLSHWYPEIGHIGSTYSMEPGKSHKPGTPFHLSLFPKIWYISAPLPWLRVSFFCLVLANLNSGQNNCLPSSHIHLGGWVSLEKLTKHCRFSPWWIHDLQQYDSFVFFQLVLHILYNIDLKAFPYSLNLSLCCILFILES